MEKGRIDWNAIRAEYIGGGISQRKLAEKYGLSRTAIQQRSKVEGWTKKREKAQAEAVSNVIRKTASAAADNAVIASRIREKLLRKLEAELDAMDEGQGTEWRETTYFVTESEDGGRPQTGQRTRIRKLRDLSAAFKDLTEDLPKADKEGRNDPVIELLRKINQECGVEDAE